MSGDSSKKNNSISLANLNSSLKKMPQDIYIYIYIYKLLNVLYSSGRKLLSLPPWLRPCMQ